MDILKELFGTSDELQINKSLFGHEVEHSDINLDQSHGLSRENVQHPLPVLPPLRRSTNPPPLPLLPVEPRPHNLPLVRSHSLENVHSGSGASKEKDLLRNYRSDSQSTFTQFNANTCTATAHVDLHSVPQEMPMYLLQEDEGNDEEIMRLMCASREASSRGDSPSDSGSGDDVVVADTQGDSLCAGERCPSSVQDSISEDLVSDGNLAFVISNPIGSVDMTEDVNHTLANEFQLLVDTATNEVTIGDEDINDAGCLVDDVISEIDIGKLDTGISSLLGLTATPTVASTAFASLSRSSEVIRVPSTASVAAEVNTRALSKSSFNSIPTTTLSAGGLSQLHPASGGPGQDLHDSARTAGISKSFDSESFPAVKTPCVVTASNTLLNSHSMREHFWTTTAVSVEPTSHHVHPASTISNRVMVNEGTQTTTGIHLQRKKTLASGRGSMRLADARQNSVVSDSTQCLASSSTSEKQVTKATNQQGSTHSYSSSVMWQKPCTSEGAPRRQTDGSQCDDTQHLTAFTTAVKRIPVMISSVTESAGNSVPSLVNPIATDSTSVGPAAPIFTSSSVIPCLTSSPVAPIFTTSSVTPTFTNSSVAPILTRNPAALSFTNSSVAPIPASSQVAPTFTNGSVAPISTRSSVAPVSMGIPVVPTFTSSPVVPISASIPAAPILTNSPVAPILSSIPTPPILTGSPSAPILQSVPPVGPLMSTLPNLDSLIQRTLLTLSSTSTQSVPSLSASTIPTSTASAQLTTSAANSARLQLARSLLNLSIPTIIPLSVSGSSEPAVAVPLPRSLVSLARMSQRSPVASEAPHGRRRSASKFLPMSASVDTRSVALAEPRNAAKHEVRRGVVEPLTVLEDVPRGLSSLPGCLAASTSNKKHSTNSLQSTVAVSPASTHHTDTCASHLEGNCAAALTAEKNLRTASTEVQRTSPEMQIEKEGETTRKEMPVILTSESLDAPNSLNTHTPTVIERELTMSLQRESEANPPNCSKPAGVTIPNAITLLSRQEKLSSHSNHTPSPRLSPTSQSHQDSSSSNSKLMVSPTFSLQIPVMDPRSNQLSHRILGLAATPVEVVHIPSRQCETQNEDSHRKKKRRHGGGWPKGKRRKLDDEPKPPKPPSTGYRLFLSDKWSEVQRETGMQSIPHLSKKLGHMWSGLRKEEKESYNVRAELDRKRYLEELKVYLENINEENLTIHESLDTFLSQIFENETNDNVLVCRLCKLTFTSLHNKRCHYSSKAHTDTLWQELNTLLGRTKGKQIKGKKARSSIARSSVVAPTEVLHTPQQECSAPVDVSLDTNGETQTDPASVMDIDCSEVEVGMYDEAADKTTGDSGRVSRTSDYVDVNGRVDMSEYEAMCIQDVPVPDCATVETATVPVSSKVVSTSPSEAMRSACPSVPAAPGTSPPAHVDSCTNPLTAPIDALSLPISAASSEKRMWSVEGGGVVRDKASTLHRSRSVLLERCDSVSTCFQEYASRTTSNMQALYEQRQLYSESLNEYSTLQQQCEELEYFSSCYEEELDCHSLEGNNLSQQLVNLLPLFKCTGDTVLVSKLESVYALMDETDSS